ncbi:PE domain-containing protein [Mycobacterium conspicuum]|uniref:Uncharacterized protein n=1 Tax=Mycobacterium conspicuum TaxID=44010 RepID=A0A1X1SSG6_9MYCO|nr:PE domain-containing protein [Mycobacterium conspicuum]ORV33384.1 hypothetical protein AWC00_27490 [Mycobacterium conspicuum]BBZ37177.1 hypothetical protein MCNS_02400 [Mycobacterium conspicuum]
MSYVITAPQMLASAATDLAGIGSSLGEANAAAAASTTKVLSAAADEVSAAIARLFSEHAQGFQAVSARASAFHDQLVRSLHASAQAYAGAEAQAIDTLKTAIFGSAAISPVPATQHPTFSGKPSLTLRIETGAMRQVRNVLTLSGIYDQMGNPNSLADRLFAGNALRPLFSTSPPKLLTALLGETVQYTTYDGMSVVQITPAHPDGNYVVALHGGAFVWQPAIFSWLDYSVMAYQTGATFEVPIYPLLQQGGTAGAVVPQIAGFLSAEIAAHGAPHVSVLGDSAGANIGLAAVEYLVAHNETVPAALVLLSPAVDLTLTNPSLGLVHDPFLPAPGTSKYFDIFPRWAGNLALNDPLVSPLYGSLDGIPPTYVYAGSIDPAAPDALALAEKAVTESAPMSFVLANGGFHDWILLSPGGVRYWAQIEHELGA